jgi:hypothetical protein
LTFVVTPVLSIINKKQLNSWQKRESAKSMLHSLIGKPDTLRQAETDPKFAMKLLEQAINAPQKVAHVAADIGTSAHDHLDRYILSPPEERAAYIPNAPESVLPVLNGMLSRKHTNDAD